MSNWLDRLDVECLHGDLLDMQTAAIACNVNQAMALNYRLGRQIEQRAGAALRRAIDDVRHTLDGGMLPLGHAVSVPVAGLAPDVERLILVAWWGRDNAFTGAFIYKCLANVLRSALHDNLESLALPLFGTGSRDAGADDFAVQLVRVLKDFDGLVGADQFSLQELYCVSDRPGDVAAVEDYAMPRLWR